MAQKILTHRRNGSKGSLAFINADDILKTVVLAAIGSVVSFTVSWVLQRWRRKG